MEFRILGPLEVADRGRLLALGGRKQRSLLAVLLLHANEVVSTERLIDGVWGESPPTTVAKSVQVYVSNLRKQLDEGRLLTREPGYVLRVDASELDLAHFEQRLAEARNAAPGTAAEMLRDALAVWRGPPLADLAFEPFAQAECARLEELRVAAQEERIDAELACGHHAELLGELEALVVEHPLRERPRRQLMLSLYRCGRHAEALEAYREARRAIVDELGLEPSRQLRSLEQAMLVQDPSLEPEPAASHGPERAGGARRTGARADTAFVGRERELRELVQALDDSLLGRGRLALLAGEPGIGKSRLSEELIAAARARGADVLVGRCWEAGGAPAYWPWVQALRAYVRPSEPGALRAQVGAGAAELAQLLPELRELLPQLSEPPESDSEGARFRLYEAIGGLLRRAAAVRPRVLMIDDLHAADEPSLLLLRFLARELADCRILLLCAYRDVDPKLDEPLVSTVAHLVREPHTLHITLAGLAEPDVAEYIELATGLAKPSNRVVEAITAETEGNPLFVVELVRLLDAENRLDEADAPVRIPPGVRAVISQRVGRLSERCRNLLVTASALGREFELDALARLCELPRDRLLEVLDEAMGEGVLSDVPESRTRLRFGHALVRDTLYEGLTSARKMQLHQRAGEALESVYSNDLEPHLAVLAHHFAAAAPVGSSEKAVEYARRAGEQAASQLAHEEAIRLYEVALALVDEPAARCELLLALGDARGRAGDARASRDAFGEAASLAQRLGLAEQLARAALGYGGRFVWQVSRDDQRHLPLLESALAALGDRESALRVRVLVRLASGPLRDSSLGPERKSALSAEALEIARRLGDPATLADALNGYIVGRHSPDHTHRQLELASELVEVATRVGDKERALDGHELRLTALLELGDKPGALAALEAMTTLTRELRQPAQNWFVAVYRALFALLEGRLDQAEELISDARLLGERAQSWEAAVSYRLQLYLLRREQGRLEAAEDIVRRSVQEYPTYPIWRCVLAQMAAELGHAVEAREALNALATSGFTTLPFDEEWLVSVGLLAETAAALKDGERASVLYELLVPYGDRVAISYPEICTGAVARYLGLLATTMKRWDDAERHFGSAIEVNRRIGARSWLARSQRDHATMLLARRAAA